MRAGVVLAAGARPQEACSGRPEVLALERVSWSELASPRSGEDPRACSPGVTPSSRTGNQVMKPGYAASLSWVDFAQRVTISGLQQRREAKEGQSGELPGH